MDVPVLADQQQLTNDSYMQIQDVVWNLLGVLDDRNREREREKSMLAALFDYLYTYMYAKIFLKIQNFIKATQGLIHDGTKSKKVTS